ncbi:MAG: hypothetical protein ACYCTB_07415 [bacterium]
MRAILKTEATKKFIENQIKYILPTGLYVKVLKRNPGHITVAEVEIMPDKKAIKEISKFCKEKIEFKLKKIDEWEEFDYMQNDLLKRENRRLKRKAKRKRKRLLKALFRGFAPNPLLFDVKKKQKPVGYL